jgi:ubiquinone/menaquinone biosynthesis C-methylase UbiE
MKKRSHRYEKMARVYDDEILPLWSQRFGRMLLRNVVLPKKAMVLDVGCGTGYPSFEIMKVMDDQGRIIALDPLGPLLDIARKKAGDLAGKRIFFRSESPSAKLAFADEVYDLVISNLGILLFDDPPRALKEFVRVTKPLGHVIVTLPLAGTYGEFFDIYREVLTKHDKEDVLKHLETYIATIPSVDEVSSWLTKAGLTDTEVEVEQFSLLFKSSREFFFAPVIEYGPLSTWKDLAGKGQEMQETFWHIKEAIDAYFGDRAFEITVKAGCLRGTKPLAATASTEQKLSAAPEIPVALETQTETVDAPAPAPAPSTKTVEKPIKDNFELDEEEDTTEQ